MVNITKRCVILLFFAAGMFATTGCGSMGSSLYHYRVVTNGCQCEEYRIQDGKVKYLFRAHYKMYNDIVTNIEIEFTNVSDDTLSLEVGSVKVSSRNIAYQYNNRFVPLPSLRITPHSSDIVKLSGTDIAEEDDWHKIAGEQLTVTIKGVKLGGNELSEQHIVFVPENPKLIQ